MAFPPTCGRRGGVGWVGERAIYLVLGNRHGVCVCWGGGRGGGALQLLLLGRPVLEGGLQVWFFKSIATARHIQAPEREGGGGKYIAGSQLRRDRVGGTIWHHIQRRGVIRWHHSRVRHDQLKSWVQIKCHRTHVNTSSHHGCRCASWRARATARPNQVTSRRPSWTQTPC